VVGPTIWAAVISGAFNRYRSLAIAVTLCGTNLATAFAPAVAHLLLEAYGWRAAFQLLALIWVTPALLLALFFFFDRRDRSHARGPSASAAGSSPARASLSGVFLSATFIRLALAVGISGTVTAAFTIHLAPALVEKGIAATLAATVAGAAGIASACGKLVAGSLFDRFGTGKVAILVMTLLALASAMLATPSASLAMAIAASALIGVAAGGNFALFTVATSRLFAPSVFGVVYGTMMSLSALSAALGPLAVSAVYDATGSYAPAFWAGLGIATVTALLLQGLTPVQIEEAPA
jgi:MFS family permease